MPIDNNSSHLNLDLNSYLRDDHLNILVKSYLKQVSGMPQDSEMINYTILNHDCVVHLHQASLTSDPTAEENFLNSLQEKYKVAYDKMDDFTDSEKQNINQIKLVSLIHHSQPSEHWTTAITTINKLNSEWPRSLKEATSIEVEFLDSLKNENQETRFNFLKESIQAGLDENENQKEISTFKQGACSLQAGSTCGDHAVFNAIARGVLNRDLNMDAKDFSNHLRAYTLQVIPDLQSDSSQEDNPQSDRSQDALNELFEQYFRPRSNIALNTNSLDLCGFSLEMFKQYLEKQRPSRFKCNISENQLRLASKSNMKGTLFNSSQAPLPMVVKSTTSGLNFSLEGKETEKGYKELATIAIDFAISKYQNGEPIVLTLHGNNKEAHDLLHTVNQLIATKYANRNRVFQVKAPELQTDKNPRLKL